MPLISQMKASKFLKRDDVGRGMLATIADVREENVAKEGAPEELKWCIHFEETDKPLVANWTNLQLIAKVVGDENSDNWTGAKVVLYDDPNVSFGGKIVGGIRVRAPKPGATPKSAPEPEPEDDEIPF